MQPVFTLAADPNVWAGREFMRGAYGTGETDMQCLREVIEATHRNAYAHHIQHLMITGNLALLTGIAPAQVEEWHLSVHADAFEWVEMPNYTRQGVACRRRLVKLEALEALCGLRRLH